jgi:hypothetical protein
MLSIEIVVDNTALVKVVGRLVQDYERYKGGSHTG